MNDKTNIYIYIYIYIYIKYTLNYIMEHSIPLHMHFQILFENNFNFIFIYNFLQL